MEVIYSDIFHCPTCAVSVRVESKFDIDFCLTGDPIDRVYIKLFLCPSCYTPFLTRAKAIFHQAGGLEEGPRDLLFPVEDFYVNPSIPEKLRKALEEAIASFRSKIFTGTAILCRRTIDGFCKEKGVNEFNLNAALKNLRDRGEINDQIFEWANELRLAGNEAAHSVDTVFSEEDAKDILDFTIAILDYSYSFHEKLMSYRNRKENNS